MAKEALKRELIEWVVRLDDPETLDFLKIIKDSKSPKRNWWRDGMFEEVVVDGSDGFDVEIAIAERALNKRMGSDLL